jgi:anthranilate synthase/aminodeoxychorismate synthase-like glutamine amidotransferase
VARSDAADARVAHAARADRAPRVGVRAPHTGPNTAGAAVVTVPWLGPTDAYAALGDRDAFLFAGGGRHPEARRSFLALRPVATIQIEGDRVVEETPAGQRVHRIEDALHVLRSATDATRLDVAEPEGFTGGWVGVIAYEAARLWEPTLPRPHERTGPDVVLRLCTDAVVFDRAARTVRIHTRDLASHPVPGPDAAARAAAIAKRLARGAPETSPVSEAHARRAAGAAPGAWRSSLDEAAFRAAVEALRQRIRTGDLFQANLATRFDADLRTVRGAVPGVAGGAGRDVDGDVDAAAGDVDPGDDATCLELFRALRTHNPGPFSMLAPFGDARIVSSSPELLFAVQDGVIRSRPIAGTRRRGRDATDDAVMEHELRTDAKEQAEHTMLVDLVRNDIARVSVPGTVRVPELMSVERYRRVMHLVSRVEGRVRPGTGFVDWLGALFPGGTVTGAPKHRACVRIREYEPVARGAYTGSAGTLSWSHNACWNILIRTAVVADGRASVHAGSGIVIASDPGREWKEAGYKARALLEAAGDATRRLAGASPDDAGTVTRHGTWSPRLPPERAAPETRVLLVDNYDSFVHNLADYCAALGADVRVIRNDEDWLGAVAAFDPTHVILSPGPGRPEDAGASLEIARSFVGRKPLLGVCLGHQCLAVAAGAAVVVADEAVHGRADEVRHEASMLFAAAGTTRGARYHSLVVDEATLPAPWRVTARLADGTVMAMEDAARRAFGLQFHPESVATRGGHEILLRFLRTA